jgi:hypothetical protein
MPESVGAKDGAFQGPLAEDWRAQAVQLVAEGAL